MHHPSFWNVVIQEVVTLLIQAKVADRDGEGRESLAVIGELWGWATLGRSGVGGSYPGFYIGGVCCWGGDWFFGAEEKVVLTVWGGGDVRGGLENVYHGPFEEHGGRWMGVGRAQLRCRPCQDSRFWRSEHLRRGPLACRAVSESSLHDIRGQIRYGIKLTQGNMVRKWERFALAGCDKSPETVSH